MPAGPETAPPRPWGDITSHYRPPDPEGDEANAWLNGLVKDESDPDRRRDIVQAEKDRIEAEQTERPVVGDRRRTALVGWLLADDKRLAREARRRAEDARRVAESAAPAVPPPTVEERLERIERALSGYGIMV